MLSDREKKISPTWEAYEDSDTMLVSRRSASRTPHGAPCSWRIFLRKHVFHSGAEKRRSDRLAYPRRTVNKHERTPPGRRHQRRGSVSVRGDARLYPSANCPMAVAKVNCNLLLRQPIATAIVRRWTSNRTSPRREPPPVWRLQSAWPQPSSVNGEPDSDRCQPSAARLSSGPPKAPCAAKTSAPTSIGPTCAERIKKPPDALSQILVPPSFSCRRALLPGGL